MKKSNTFFKVGPLIVLGLLFTGSIFGKSFRDRLVETVDLSKRLSGQYRFYFTLGKERLDLIQDVKIKYCRLEILTKHPKYGVIYRDTFDLSRDHAHRKLLPFKGAYAVSFGLKTNLKGRSKLYFNYKSERNAKRKVFKKLTKMCHKKDIKERFDGLLKISGTTKIKKVPGFVGNLPERSGITEGKVYVGPMNKMAHLNGRHSLIERVRSLKSAKKAIYIEKLIFRGDEVGKYFLDLLLKKKKEGLDIRVVVDLIIANDADFALTPADKKNTQIIYNNLMAAGVRVYGWACKKRNRTKFQGVNIEKLIQRNHEKLWIIDPDDEENSLGIVGGINIASEYFALTGYHTHHSWRDQDLSVKGPIVRDIRDSFMRSYYNRAIRFRSYEYDKDCFNPYDPIKETAKWEAFKKEKTKEFHPQESKKDEEFAAKLRKHLKLVLDGHNEGPNFTGPLFQVKPIKYTPVVGSRFIHARPEEHEKYAEQVYLDLINKADKEIIIANAYFVPTRKVFYAFAKAIKRGVKIIILTNNEVLNDLPFIATVGRSNYLELSFPEGGLEDIYEDIRDELSQNKEFIGTHQISNPIEIWEWEGKKKGASEEEAIGMMHSKYMIIDGKVGLVGSYNFDYSSTRNGETVLLFDSEELSEELREQFLDDLDYSRKIDKDEMIEFKDPKNILRKIKLRFLKLIETFV